MTETTEEIGMKRPFYAIYRLILGMGAAVGSGIECSCTPFVIFLIASLFLDWLILGKWGFKESSCLSPIEDSKIKETYPPFLDRYAIQMMHFRSMAVPLSLLLTGVYYLFSKKHHIEFPIPILVYSFLIVGHKIYHYYRFGFLTAYPLAKEADIHPSNVGYRGMVIDPKSPLSPWNLSHSRFIGIYRDPNQ